MFTRWSAFHFVPVQWISSRMSRKAEPVLVLKQVANTSTIKDLLSCWVKAIAGWHCKRWMRREGEFGLNMGTSRVVAPSVGSRWGLWCAGVVWLIITFSHVSGYCRSSTGAEANTKCFVMTGTPAQLQSFLFWDVLALQNSLSVFQPIWEQRVEGHVVLFRT